MPVRLRISREASYNCGRVGQRQNAYAGGEPVPERRALQFPRVPKPIISFLQGLALTQ